jgi:hypothetical protein
MSCSDTDESEAMLASVNKDAEHARRAYTAAGEALGVLAHVPGEQSTTRRQCAMVHALQHD